MKNLKAYIYMYVCTQLLLSTFLVAAISYYFNSYYIIAGYGLLLLAFCGYPCIPFKTLCKTRNRKDTDIMRDFVYARKCGKITAGKNYIYIMKGLQMHIIPAEDVTWVYGINQTVTEYYGRREKHVRNHLYVSVHLKGEKEYKLQISEHNLKILMGAMREYPSIRLGYN